MADVKISDYAAATAILGTDQIEVLDDPGGSPDNVKATFDLIFTDMLKAPATIGGTTPGIGSFSTLTGTSLQIQDTSLTNQYVVTVSELAANRNINLPLLAGNDVFVFADHAQTLTGKTITFAGNTLTGVQAQDAVLDDLAGIVGAVALDEFIVGTAAGVYAHQNPTTARASLGLGALAILATVNNATWSGADLSVANGGTGVSTLTNHGVVIGQAAAAVAVTAAGTAGQVLTSNGAAADPTFQAAAGLPAPDFESTQQTVTKDTKLSVAHSIGAVPTLVQVVLVCTTADLDYAVGDELVMATYGGQRGTADEGVTIYSDGTNVHLVQGAEISLLSDTSFNGNITVVTRWRWVVRAWA